MADRLVVERDGAVATLRFNRPESRNAISLEMYQATCPISWARPRQGRRRSQVVVLRGAGEKAFAAGADIERVRGRCAATARSARTYNEFVSAARSSRSSEMTKPTIAMVHGLLHRRRLRDSRSRATSASPTPRRRFAITP